MTDWQARAERAETALETCRMERAMKHAQVSAFLTMNPELRANLADAEAQLEAVRKEAEWWAANLQEAWGALRKLREAYARMFGWYCQLGSRVSPEVYATLGWTVAETAAQVIEGQRTLEAADAALASAPPADEPGAGPCP